MIYKFRIVTDEDEKFLRDIEIESDDTFLSLHNAIQESVNYDNSQLASFFVSNMNWEKGTQITLLDMKDDHSSEEVYLMDETRINEHISKRGQNLLYIFDFFSDRAFFMTLLEIKEKTKKGLYPQCVQSLGEAPEQIVFEDTEMEDIYEGAMPKSSGKRGGGSRSSDDEFGSVEEYYDEDELDDLNSFDDDEEDEFGGGGYGGGSRGGYGGGYEDDYDDYDGYGGGRRRR